MVVKKLRVLLELLEHVGRGIQLQFILEHQTTHSLSLRKIAPAQDAFS